MLARLGGDEFGVIAPIGEDEAYELALALRATLSYPVTVGSTTERIDVSIGYTLIMPTLTLAQLLHQADLAMYEAKRSGQGISLWQAQMGKK